MSLAKEFEDFASEVGDELNRINRSVGTRTVADKLATESKTLVGAINELASGIKEIDDEIGTFRADFVDSFLREVNKPDEDDCFWEGNEPPCHCPPEHKPPHQPPQHPPHRPRF